MYMSKITGKCGTGFVFSDFPQGNNHPVSVCFCVCLCVLPYLLKPDRLGPSFLTAVEDLPMSHIALSKTRACATRRTVNRTPKLPRQSDCLRKDLLENYGIVFIFLPTHLCPPVSTFQSLQVNCPLVLLRTESAVHTAETTPTRPCSTTFLLIADPCIPCQA